MDLQQDLPQLSGQPFLTDSGLETILLFMKGFDLPCFASFPLLNSPLGAAAINQYYRDHIEIAQNSHVGIVLESVTWRANPDWGRKLGYDSTSLAQANHQAIKFLNDLKLEYSSLPIVVSGCIGPRCDGYQPEKQMTQEESQIYHQTQINTLGKAGAGLVTAMTMSYAAEAIGIVRAAQIESVPVVISFTVETDGRLPTSQSLVKAIAEVDNATGGYPAYYMINCAHPTHFFDVLENATPELSRIKGLRANGSKKSHQELDESTNLDSGDPDELAISYLDVKEKLPELNIFGGCCGTDPDHIKKIVEYLPLLR